MYRIDRPLKEGCQPGAVLSQGLPAPSQAAAHPFAQQPETAYPTPQLNNPTKPASKKHARKNRGRNTDGHPNNPTKRASNNHARRNRLGKTQMVAPRIQPNEPTKKHHAQKTRGRKKQKDPSRPPNNPTKRSKTHAQQNRRQNTDGLASCRSVCSWLLMRTNSWPVSFARNFTKEVFPAEVGPSSRMGNRPPLSIRAMFCRFRLESRRSRNPRPPRGTKTGTLYVFVGIKGNHGNRQPRVLRAPPVRDKFKCGSSTGVNAAIPQLQRGRRQGVSPKAK